MINFVLDPISCPLIIIDCQVVVIEKGEVVEQGTHDQLIAQGGVYKQLVLRQLTAGELTNGNC